MPLTLTPLQLTIHDGDYSVDFIEFFQLRERKVYSLVSAQRPYLVYLPLQPGVQPNTRGLRTQ